ncbi:MAG: hypothetical protein OXE42_13350 [Gammaproteobacteria bacterium]|nr:hypothetical protein [Gammaproteobacteria bacterium]
MSEELRALMPLLELPVPFLRETRTHEIPSLAMLVNGDDQAVGDAGQRPGTVHDLLQHGVDIETGTDAQDRSTQLRDPLAQRRVLACEVSVVRHWPSRTRRKHAVSQWLPDALMPGSGLLI